MFRGRAIGALGHATGEVVFNTAMTGYQEILTDPSYAGQIVTLTYPHIGNIGVNAEDVESRRRLRRRASSSATCRGARRTGARRAISSTYLRERERRRASPTSTRAS